MCLSWDLSNPSVTMTPTTIARCQGLCLESHACQASASTNFHNSEHLSWSWTRLSEAVPYIPDFCMLYRELWQSARQGRRKRSKPGFWKARVIPSPDSNRKRLKGFQDPPRSCVVQSSATVSGTVTLASLVSLCSFEGSNGANPGNRSLL